MNPPHAVIQEVQHLLGSPVDPHILEGGVVRGAVQRLEKARGIADARRLVGHGDEVLARKDGHDAGNDRYPDSGELAALAEIEEDPVVEKELRADVVCARVHLFLEQLDLPQPVRRRGMSLGVACYPDAHSGELPVDEADQLARMGEPALGGRKTGIAARRVAPERHHILDPALAIGVEDPADL